MIKIKPIASYYSDDDKAVLARKAELTATGKRRQSELAELDAAMANQGDIDPTPEDHIQNLIAGVDVPRPQPLTAKRLALQYNIRDIEQALDFMAGKERQVATVVGARLAKDIKPQHDIAAKELADALVVAHEKHLAYWIAKRHLINNGIGLFGLFDSNVDDILGTPVDKDTPLADLFRAAVKDSYLKNVPAQLR